MSTLSPRARLSIVLLLCSAPSLGHAAPAESPRSSSANAPSSPNAPNASAVLARADARAQADRAAALQALERLTPLAARRKECLQRMAEQSKELKRHSSSAVQAEKAQQAASKQKYRDAQAADLFALAVYHYDEAAKLAETLMIANGELKKLEGELTSQVKLTTLAMNRVLTVQKEIGGLLKDVDSVERAALKAKVDELTTAVNATKKASADAQARAGLGSPDSYAAQKPKRDAADAKLQADRDKALADRARAFAAVRASRAPGCDLHQVDFKNRDYEGMSAGGRAMPIRNGQIPDADAETFGLPWVVSQVSYSHLSKDGAEQAIVGFSNQSADAPAGMSLVFDLGSECTVRYRGSVADFLSECSGQHCYVSSPHRILPGGGAAGCDASELGIANDKVVSRSLAKAPPGVCD